MCKKSESITELAKALVKFNGEVSKIEKDSKNPHFKNTYASLDNIIDEIRPILTKHGLAIIQMPGGDGDMFSMTTMLMHESGEWMESDPIIMRPVKNDPQGIGSCTTYARRYSLAAFLSLNTGEDDDGHAASHGHTTTQQTGQRRIEEEKAKASQNKQNGTQGQTGPSQDPSDNPNPITEGQKKMFFVKAKQAGFDLNKTEEKETMWELLSAHLARMVFHVDHLQKTEFNDILKWFDAKQAELQPN